MANSNSPSLSQVLIAMLNIARDYLPPAVGPLPTPSVSVISMRERSVGLGNYRGNEPRGSFSVAALKGLRIEAVIRYQLWAGTPGDVEAATRQLSTRLLGDRDQLQVKGFVRLALTNTGLSESVPAVAAWRQSVEISVLYEFPYMDSDGAESLIARIPIEFTGEFNESTVVTDDMVRWDEVETPALEVRRRGRRPKPVNSLVIFAFLPAGFNGDGLTVSVSINGVTRQKSFANLRAFHDAFDLEAETPERPLAELGGNKYRAGQMKFPNADFPAPILLTRGDDVMEISYASPSLGNNKAVVYLRAI